jgi:prepilin-type N-terminal cleavage/methylation domain-containing protein/prepilin-type processing-associated H-X9-DG protein
VGRKWKSAIRAFTLIELLVVIAIIAILAAILFPVFAQARESARKASCQSNLKQLATAGMMYSQDYDEIIVPSYLEYRLPGTQEPGYWAGWSDLVQPYTKNYGIMRCQSSNGAGVTTGRSDDAWWMSYAINWRVGGENGGLTGQGGDVRAMAACQFPASTFFFFDASAACNDNCRQADSGGWPEAWTYPPSANQVAWGDGPGYAARHQGGANYAFMDGHVKFLRAEKVRSEAFNNSVVNGVQFNRSGSTPTFFPN